MKLGARSKPVSLFLIGITLLLFSTPEAFSTTVGEITQALTCTCACNMVVSSCEGSMECTAAKNITDQVTRMIEKGKFKDEIIRYFVKTHGERILAAPTKKGFNLTAWILPFLVIVLAAGGIYIFLDRCLASRKSITDTRENVEQRGKTIDRKYFDQCERELKQFDL